MTDDVALVERFTRRGRPMDGWVRVDGAAVEDDPALGRWVRRGLEHARAVRRG